MKYQRQAKAAANQDERKINSGVAAKQAKIESDGGIIGKRHHRASGSASAYRASKWQARHLAKKWRAAKNVSKK